ncbi:MAG: Bax inhibitor-1/YccA family protein [Bacteroidaceae bacterium]|nr:Bax inhibitor-1/YccA family protein [Bacteroidaceae bacterium]
MNDFTSNYDRGSGLTGINVFASVMTRVYGWMTLALLLTGGVAVYTASNLELLRLIYGSQAGIWILIIAELGIVMTLSAAINRLSPATAVILFLIYSALNGLTLSTIFFAYERSTIYQAFFASALTFGGMSLFGYTTKRDLTSLRGFLLMTLLGLLIATVVNFFMQSEGFSMLLTYVGVFLFVGLTAYDTQKIKQMTYAAQTTGDEATVGRIAILGALSLYLDFINLFLYILRLFGRRSN